MNGVNFVSPTNKGQGYASGLGIRLTTSKEMKVRRAKDKEMEARRAKGLCYWFPESFIAGHVCKEKQIFVIEVEETDSKTMSEP